MGRKGKAEQYGLIELIVSKHDGGKNTVVYVTQEVNRWLEENGLKIKFSREAIRRVIKTHEEEIADAKKSIEAAKAMAEILKDNPGTEATEAVVMMLASVIGKEIRQIDGVSFDDPSKLVAAITRLAEVQQKLSNTRIKAVAGLDKAKEKIKDELRAAITADPELLQRLIDIIDKVQI